MRICLILATAVAAFCAPFAPAAASEPCAPGLLQTGQTIAYIGDFGDQGSGNRDDGDLRLGRAREYVYGDDGTIDTQEENIVLDGQTGLMWVRDLRVLDATTEEGAAGNRRFDEEMEWGEALSRCGDFVYGGFDDWRLPNVRELHTIADYGRTAPALDVDVFPGPDPGYEWSSTTPAFATGEAWYINFTNGHLYVYSKRAAFKARPVRSASPPIECPVALMRTGQATSYSPGDDGNLQLGLEPHYLCNPEGTIDSQYKNVAVDVNTGLMWLRDPSLLQVESGAGANGNKVLSEPLDWQTAIDRVNSLTYAGYDDWRLPNLFELASLTLYGISPPTLDTSIFPNVPPAGDPSRPPAWWTSTTPFDEATCAWYVTTQWGTVNHGAVPPIQKLEKRFVRPVRTSWPLGAPSIQVR